MKKIHNLLRENVCQSKMILWDSFTWSVFGISCCLTVPSHYEYFTENSDCVKKSWEQLFILSNNILKKEDKIYAY